MATSLRSQSREFAMQMLYQWEMSPQDVKKLQAKFWKDATASEDTEIFANQLFEATVRTVQDLDGFIEKHCENWRSERIAATDRAILRLAMHELWLGKTPARSVINEALKLAKKYSGDDSARFVNGVLNAAHQSRSKASPDRHKAAKPKQ
jgi:transcription antitermination factor NusB